MTTITDTRFYLENFFWGEPLNMYGCMGGAHSEREYFGKSAQRNVIDPFALLSFGSSINLTSREKVSVHWGN